MAESKESKYIDLAGLTHFYEKFKEYVMANFLLRKTYDLSVDGSLDSKITGSITYDSVKKASSITGTITITLDRTTSCNVIIDVVEGTSGASISAYGSSYSPANGSTLCFNVKDVDSVTFDVTGTYYVTSIAIEESSLKIPTKVSDLENDAGFVNMDVQDETLQFSVRAEVTDESLQLTV